MASRKGEKNGHTPSQPQSQNAIHSSITLKETTSKPGKIYFPTDGVALVDRMYSGKLARLYSPVESVHGVMIQQRGPVLFFNESWWRHLYIKGVAECLDFSRWRKFPMTGQQNDEPHSQPQGTVRELRNNNEKRPHFPLTNIKKILVKICTNKSIWKEKGESSESIHRILICGVSNVHRLTDGERRGHNNEQVPSGWRTGSPLLETTEETRVCVCPDVPSFPIWITFVCDLFPFSPFSRLRRTAGRAYRYG